MADNLTSGLVFSHIISFGEQTPMRCVHMDRRRQDTIWYLGILGRETAIWRLSPVLAVCCPVPLDHVSQAPVLAPTCGVTHDGRGESKAPVGRILHANYASGNTIRYVGTPMPWNTTTLAHDCGFRTRLRIAVSVSASMLKSGEEIGSH